MGVKEGLITLLAGSPGQLYTRIHHLNGSLDKPWLLLFLFFPLSDDAIHFNSSLHDGIQRRHRTTSHYCPQIYA